MSNPQYVSVHGGHSGQFCLHARDNLESLVLEYIKHGYQWVGITEHTPPINDDFLYPDEKEANLSAKSLNIQFSQYIKECKRLKHKYADQITIYCAFEIETYSGYERFVDELIAAHQPDYIVGSVHFVDDMGFDYSLSQYQQIVKTLGGYDQLYCRYFDLQYEMIKQLQPAVVGHFDLIRLYDSEYQKRLEKDEVKQRILRNLELIKEYDLILDYNLRALQKGATEPYISESILQLAMEMEISVVPGDDSHCVSDIHQYMDQALITMKNKGVNLAWPKPRIYEYSQS